MYFFFADDSSHKSARKALGKLLAFGGVLIAADKLRVLSAEIDAILAKYGAPANEEIKWSPRKGKWIYENLKDDARQQCYSEVLAVAAKAECKAIVVACDYEMRNLRPEWGFERCVTYALERVATYTANLQSEAVVIADRPSGGHKQADQFLAAFAEQLNDNHNHMVAGSFALNMLTAPSHMVRHLQVADLVVSITTAMLSGETKFASHFFEQIKPMFIRNALGYIGGTGVKVYPDELINLYYWVLGEKEFSKASLMTAWPLPHIGILFVDGDGT